VKFFSKSPHSTQQFRKCLKDLKLPELELVQGCKTRWSSYHDMLEVLLKVKPGLIRAQTVIDYSYDRLNEPDWVLVAKVVAYLEPFAELTRN
jgi:hypothetical protein